MRESLAWSVLRLFRRSCQVRSASLVAVGGARRHEAPGSHGSREQRGGGRGACDRRARLGCAVVCTGLVRAGVRCRGVCGLISSPVHAQAG